MVADMHEEAQPVMSTNHWADAVGYAGYRDSRDICWCFDQRRNLETRRMRFHAESQDASSEGWQHLLALVEEAAADGREEFRPLADPSAAERREVITLPPSIAKLTTVKHFVLYGSNLVRIPPQIGAMTSLEEFSPYTSHRLHWFPYELTRCRNLTRSTVSTRVLYGNFKLRPQFPRLQSGTPAPVGSSDHDAVNPRLWGADALGTCSVCDLPFGETGVHQAWISLRVATDVLPLLVNACSSTCLQELPAPAEGHVPRPHTGGPDVAQPVAGYL